ncbi:hypothetical protein SDC9_100746 [bioreactor metagenome]|uniref:Uncharacterized protein n=1 Tax=bioreactor metagenome TaxID=1076179 RepID=A0A645AWP8_9ZZZZ
MHADDGVLQSVAHFGDGQRRGVGREDCLGLAHGVQLVQQLLLGGHVFLDALDDQVGVRTGGFFLHQHICQQGVHRLLRHLALFNTLLQGSRQLILVLLRGSDGTCIHKGGVALRRENLSNSAAHRTCAKNCNFHVNPPIIFTYLWDLFHKGQYVSHL